MSPVFRGPVLSVEAPKGNLINFVFKDAHKWSQWTALECGVTGSKVSYAELQTLMGRWGYWLTHHSGVFTPRRSVVAFLSTPTVEYVVTLLGTISAAGTVFALHSGYVPSELSHQMHVSSPSLLIVSESLEDKLVKAFAVLGRTIPYVVIGRSDREVAGRYHDIVSDNSLQVMEPLEITGDETLAYAQTSGSTGLPKLVKSCHNSAIFCLAATLHPHWTLEQSGAGEQLRTLLNRNFGLSAGLIFLLLPNLTIGGCMVVVKDMVEQELITDIQELKINQLLVVPPLLSTLLRIPEEAPAILSHLKTIFIAGATAPKALIEATQATMPSVMLQDSYGLTETFSLTLTPLTGHKPDGFMSQLLPNVQVKVVDIISGQLLTDGRQGIIYVKCPWLMKGYLNNEAATQEVLDADGWLCTGDVGIVDEEGFLKITDRAKEMIKREEAFAVSPTELENSLLEHPKVKEACVVGVLQPKTGLDSIWAFVSLCLPGDGLTEEDIKDIISNKFNPMKHLDQVVIMDILPKNSTHKLDRRLLKERASATAIEDAGN